MSPDDRPICTCIWHALPFTGLRVVKVFDPYCQLQQHKDRGTYTGPEPVYGKGST